MKKNVLFVLWGGLFILCAGLGFIPHPGTGGQNLMILSALGFFVPPGLLLWQGFRQKDLHVLKLVRNLSVLSLVLTVALILLNILSALGSETLGNVLNSMLILVSSPMYCLGSWAVSLFFWACLMLVSIRLIKNT